MTLRSNLIPPRQVLLAFGNMSIDQIRKMSARIEKEKRLRKKHLILLVRKMVMSTMMVRKMSTDSYLMKRRKAIGSAMKKRLKEERASLSEVMTDKEDGQKSHREKR